MLFHACYLVPYLANVLLGFLLLTGMFVSVMAMGPGFRLSVGGSFGRPLGFLWMLWMTERALDAGLLPGAEVFLMSEGPLFSLLTANNFA